MGSLKKKAINASTKLKHSLKKVKRRKIEGWVSSVSVEDVRDVEDFQVVEEFRQAWPWTSCYYDYHIIRGS